MRQPKKECPACGPGHCTPSCPERAWRYAGAKMPEGWEYVAARGHFVNHSLKRIVVLSFVRDLLTPQGMQIISDPRTFEQVWAEKEAEGYQYGEDALEQVKFGWELAMKELKRS